MDLTVRLHDLARSRGAVASGVATVAPFIEVRATMAERIEDGSRGGLGFTYRDPETATNVRSSFPWARSLLAVATSYLPQAGTPDRRPGHGRIARFATRDHYGPLRLILEEIVSVLRLEGFKAVALQDDNRLVDRAVAVRSGVGWWGLSSMVLTPGAGPWTLLGAVATDALLKTSTPMERSCGTCRACFPACPTGAIVGPGKLDARKCISYVLQAPGIIPRELRPAIDDRIYGCDDCLTSCPPGSRLLERSTSASGSVDLLDFLTLSDDTILARYSHFYVPGRRARYLRRNALVAIGNWASERSVGALAGYVGHSDWLLRLHASWALGRVGGSAIPVIEKAKCQERNPRVIDELDLAYRFARSAACEEPNLR